MPRGGYQVLTPHQQRDRDAWMRYYPNIRTTTDLRAAVREGPYAWPGGYPLYAVAQDGEALCFDCLRTEYRQILWAVKNEDKHSGWRIIGIDTNWEDPSLRCTHCSKLIESAYGEEVNE